MKNASPYKTAAELGIEQWEHDGLAALIGPLSRGEIELDMARTYRQTECGTVCCIGGWLAFNKRVQDQTQCRRTVITDYVKTDHSPALFDLFWDEAAIHGEVTSANAAAAIVNFLTLGDPRWSEAMAGAP